MVFNFDKNEVESFLKYELSLLNKIAGSFNYTHATLKKLGHFKNIGKRINLNDCKWNEGKNYDWLALSSGTDVDLIVRKYNTHFTIYTRYKKMISPVPDRKWVKLIHGAFTYFSNAEEDFYYDNNAHDLNKSLSKIVEMIRGERIHAMWNDLSFPRPANVEVKNIYDGESIYSYDRLVFACEELSSINSHLFAENEMFEKIKTIKKGDKLGKYTVKEVVTKLKDGYYHGVGLKLSDENYMKDVYCLTHHYLDDIFPDLKKPEDFYLGL